jgi:hypothetical protein
MLALFPEITKAETHVTPLPVAAISLPTAEYWTLWPLERGSRLGSIPTCHLVILTNCLGGRWCQKALILLLKGRMGLSRES